MQATEAGAFTQRDARRFFQSLCALFLVPGGHEQGCCESSRLGV